MSALSRLCDGFLARRCQQAHAFALTVRRSVAPSVRPVRRGCFREALRWQSGMRCPAPCLVSKSREAPGSGPPPLRADAKSAFTRVFDALRSSQGRIRNVNARAVPAVLNPAVERRKASVPRYGARGAALWRLRAYVTGPRRVPRKHPSASRRSAPSQCEGIWQTSERSCLARTMMYG
jgi:hypothetical protein